MAERFSAAIRDAQAPAWAVETGPGTEPYTCRLHCRSPVCEAETVRILAEGGSGAALSQRALDEMAATDPTAAVCDRCGRILARRPR
jgi:hypothetical protein